MDNEVLVALIAIIPTMTTVITSLLGNRRNAYIQKVRDEESRRDQAKNSINLLILHDKVNWGLGRQLPTNLDNILVEMDKYENNYGNSYMHKLVNEYEEWYKSVEKEVKCQKKTKRKSSSKK